MKSSMKERCKYILNDTINASYAKILLTNCYRYTGYMKKHLRKALQGKAVQEIYETVRGIYSDAHSVNERLLTAEISRQHGLE